MISARAILAAWADLPPRERLRLLEGFPPGLTQAIEDRYWPQRGQIEPATDWRVWAIVAGRGFGKTRAGAEWIWARARERSDARIALVAASLDEVAKVMVEGESGLLSAARRHEAARWISSRGVLRFPSGAEAFAYTAERPDMLRGPQHHYAWCDELAKWPPSTGSGQAKADATWDNLMLGLRLGARARTIVTTTPKPVPLLKRILADPRCARTHGRTDENPHLAGDYQEAMAALYAGTRLGRQELDGLLLEDLPGALWTREMLEKARHVPSPIWGEGRLAAGERGEGASGDGQSLTLPPGCTGRAPPSPQVGEGFSRIVIGLDPPASTGGDACGIVVCGMGADGVAYVLADLTASGLSPEAWARRVAAAAEQWQASLIVAEKNQGGDMIESVLRGVDAALPVRLVAATRSKAARAEPVALRFETGKAKLAGSFPELEDQLCALTYKGYEGQGSPDRADAMVWAMSELLRPGREPRVRGL